jgi:Pretoxin HINT domain
MFHFAVVSLCLLAAVPADSPTREEMSAYQAAAARAGRDAQAHIRLATWCELHGMQVERHKHLGIALELAPDHPAIHGLLGQVADNEQWRMPQAITEDYQTDAQAKETLALYRARREKSPDTPQAHWQLAQWCEENGLKPEAKSHFAAVVRLNPSREEAWKKLGFQKPKGRWTTAELTVAQHDETDRQRKADAHWRPLLEKWNGWLTRKAKRDEVQAALAKVRDPRAVPSIWKIFATGGPAQQELAVRLLGQIDAPASSRALGSLAVSGLTDGVRGHAADSLLKRDPREFAGLLIAVMRDPIVFEVREVQGPGRPGELYIHGERMNRRFFYEAPPPLATLRPTDIVGFDSFGLPVANRVVGFALQPAAAAVNPLLNGAPDLSNAPQVLGHLLGPAGTALGQKMAQNQQIVASSPLTNMMGNVMMPLTYPIPVGQLKIQAEQTAAASKAQLLEDVAALDRYNSDVNGVNDRATQALATALLETHGPKRKDWVKWLAALGATSTSAAPRPLEPNREKETSVSTDRNRAMLPGFGAGTPVWTLAGQKPIESLRTGDQVLAQHAETGALTYNPVIAVSYVARQPIKTITLGKVLIDTTHLERFWLAGTGWVMAGDLKAGDAIRATGGIRAVTAVGDADPQAVYHVQVEAGRGILVGEFGALVHDEQVARPVASPFDSAAIEPAQSAR